MIGSSEFNLTISFWLELFQHKYTDSIYRVIARPKGVFKLSNIIYKGIESLPQTLIFKSLYLCKLMMYTFGH